MATSRVISKDQCQRILERYTKTKESNLLSYLATPFEDQLNGLICDQYFLKIDYELANERKCVQFFLKTLSVSNSVIYEIAKSIYAFEKEQFYYETFIPMLKSKSFTVDYAPRSYLAKFPIIVLEDLGVRSFQTYGKNKLLDLNHCKKSLEILAKFHAQPIMYELIRSKELGRHYSLINEFRDILEDKVFSGRDNAAARYMKCSVEGLFPLIDLIPENGVDKTEFKTTLQHCLEEISFADDSRGFRSTLLHSDLWSNNILFKYQDSEIIDTVLIDFQTLNYGPPAVDVFQFIFSNTRKSFRDEHLNEMVHHYYKSFSGLLAEQGFYFDEILSESQFQESCQVCALPAKVFTVVDRCILLSSNKYHAEASENEETFSRYLFEDRGKYIVRGFNEDEYFKEVITEDITELRDMLFTS